MPPVLIQVHPDARTCHHETVEELGRNQAASFYMCAACGSVVIAQGPHRWIIRPTDEAGPLPF